MKFTGIVASLAAVGAASAAAIPDVKVVRVQSTITRLDGVLGTVEGLLNGVVDTATNTVGNTVGTATNAVGTVTDTVIDTVCQKDLTIVKTELTGIHNELNTLVGGAVGKVGADGLVVDVTNVASDVVDTAVHVLGSVTEVRDVTYLSQILVSRVQSGDIDVAGLESLLTILAGNTGLAHLNYVLAQAL